MTPRPSVGGGLFLVTLADEQGTSEHEVGVPDGLMEDLLGDDDVSQRDVVLASLDWWLSRGVREELPEQVSLDEWRDTGDYEEQLAARGAGATWPADPGGCPGW